MTHHIEVRDALYTELATEADKRGITPEVLVNRLMRVGLVIMALEGSENGLFMRDGTNEIEVRV